MATVLDITSKLQQEEKLLRIGDKEFRVDDSKNTVIKAMALIDDNSGDSMEAMDSALKLLVGDKAFTAIEAMSLSFKGYRNVFMGVIALASDTSFEEMEKRFQNEVQ